MHRRSIGARCSRCLVPRPAHRSTGARQRTRSSPRGWCLAWAGDPRWLQSARDVGVGGRDEAARLPATNTVYRQTWHTRTETALPDRVKRRSVRTAPPHRVHVFVSSSMARPESKPCAEHTSGRRAANGASMVPENTPAAVAPTGAGSLFLPESTKLPPDRCQRAQPAPSSASPRYSVVHTNMQFCSFARLGRTALTVPGHGTKIQ